MEKDPECPHERIAEIRSAYEDFKIEAKKKKTTVKNGQSSVAEFRDWTLQQLERIIWYIIGFQTIGSEVDYSVVPQKLLNTPCFQHFLLTKTPICFKIKTVTEGVSQPISEKVMSEFLLTLNKKFTSECFATHKCEFNKGKFDACP